MKSDTAVYKAKLNAADSKIRNTAIRAVAASGDAALLKFMLETVFRNRKGNSISVAVTALGDAANKEAVPLLPEYYQLANRNERRLIIETLLQLGAFDRVFGSNAAHKNNAEQLWALLFGSSTAQLKACLALPAHELRKELDFAWKATSHWRE